MSKTNIMKVNKKITTQFVRVENGYICSANMNNTIISKTMLDDGMYIIGKDAFIPTIRKLEEFQKMPDKYFEDNSNSMIEIEASWLKVLCGMTSFAVKSKHKSLFSGLHIKGIKGNEYLQAETTNGKQIARKTIPAIIRKDIEVVIPVSTLNILAEYKGGKPIKIDISDRMKTITSDFILLSVLSDVKYTYPNLEIVIKSHFPSGDIYNVSRLELMHALDDISIISDSNSCHKVMIEIMKTTIGYEMVLTCENKRSGCRLNKRIMARKRITISLSYCEIDNLYLLMNLVQFSNNRKIYNSKYLLDMVKNMKSDELCIGLPEKYGAMILSENNIAQK